MKTKGFTLIELLLTMVVMSAGLMGIMMMFENATKGALQADVNAIAANLAHEKLESIVADKVWLGYAGITQARYSSSETFTYYTRSTQVTEVSPTDLATAQPGSGHKRVEVTVRWGAANSQRVTVPTILSSY